MLISALAVGGTWLICLVLATGCGLAVLPGSGSSASTVRTCGSVGRARSVSLTRVRSGLWVGAAVLTAAVLGLNLIRPLNTVTVAVLCAVVLVIAGFGFWRNRALLTSSLTTGLGSDRLFWVWVLGAGAAVGLLALQALGMPINYDAGLYQLNAVSYAHDFATIPGLANVHDRLGFNSSLYSLAAALGNGLWANEGFRLVSGVFLAALAVETVLRVMDRRHRRSVGTLVVSVCAAFTIGYALIEPGRLVASPVADVTTTALLIVSLGALADTLGNRRAGQGTTAADGIGMLNSAIAVAAAGLAATMRPLAWVVALVVVCILITFRRRCLLGSASRIALAVVMALGTLMLVRDVLLSGWLLFPMGLAPMPVDWRLPDPGTTSAAIASWARAPHQDPANAEGLAWLPGWIASLRTDWATLAASLMLAVAVVGWLVIRIRGTPGPVFVRPPAWVIAPIAAGLGIWWVTAPDPRFAWGLILLAGALPLALVTTRFCIGPKVVLVGAVTTLLLLGLAAFARGSFTPVIKDVRPAPRELGSLTVTLMLAPPKEVPVREVMLSDGTRTMQPTEGLQCWQVFPLCRLPGAPDDMVSRGTGIQDGFAPR